MGKRRIIPRNYEAGFATRLTKRASREAVGEAIASVTGGDGS